jgi:hypothetical protein
LRARSSPADMPVLAYERRTIDAPFSVSKKLRTLFEETAILGRPVSPAFCRELGRGHAHDEGAPSSPIAGADRARARRALGSLGGRDRDYL